MEGGLDGARMGDDVMTLASLGNAVIPDPAP